MLASPGSGVTGARSWERIAVANENSGAVQAGAPSLSVLAQYLKDFSFESPGAPISLQPREKAPNIGITINVRANPLSATDIEVELKLDARAVEEGDRPIFVVETTYAGLFRITNLPQDQMHPLVMIECPRLLFPFARQIVADATRHGGFPPLLIDPVDFVALYQKRAAEASQQVGQA